MAIVICEQCKAEIEVPAGYDAPFIKCTECGAPQRVMQAPVNGPKFKILDKQGRINAANYKVDESEVSDVIEEQPAVSQTVKKPIVQQVKLEHNPTFKPIEEEKMILDSVGQEGIKKALEFVSEYVCLTSPKAKLAGRAKAIQKMMKEKYPASMASKAIAYAERLPEAVAIAKARNVKKAIIVAATAAILIAGVLSFL